LAKAAVVVPIAAFVSSFVMIRLFFVSRFNGSSGFKKLDSENYYQLNPFNLLTIFFWGLNFDDQKPLQTEQVLGHKSESTQKCF
jgi:hypothetical protein